jgi:hypothetical protein
MAVRMSWLVLGCSLAACSGHSSTTSDEVAEGGAKAVSETVPREPVAESAAGESSGPTAAGSGAGGASTASGGEDAAAGTTAVSSDGGESSPGGVADGGEAPVEFPSRAVCGPDLNEYSKRYCAALSTLSLSFDAIEDAGGDGTVSPGEEARLVFSLHNSGAEAFVAGPCVGVLGALPGLTVLEPYNPIMQLYGVAEGRSGTMKLRVRVEPDATPGTRIPLLAWLDVHGALCPDGDELRFELRVAP